MRDLLLALILATLPLTCRAGAIARQYESGFEGVTWGDSLAELVTKRPDGQHDFVYGGGHRAYSVADEKTLFNIARSHMRVAYFLDETGSVDSASISFPYNQRSKLLGALTLSFGPYKRMFTRGISTYYQWSPDDGVVITVEATSDPVFGMLRMGVFGPNSSLDRSNAENCGQPAKRKAGQSP